MESLYDGGNVSVTIIPKLHQAKQRFAFAKNLLTVDPMSPTLSADLIQRILQSGPLQPTIKILEKHAASVYKYILISNGSYEYPWSPPQIFLTKVGDQDIKVDVTGKITKAMYETYRARYAGEGHLIQDQIKGDATSQVSVTADWSPLRILCCLRLTPDVEQDVEQELA